MPLVLLILVFILVPIAELYVIIKVGEWIGVLPTLALLIADSIAGSMLLKYEGKEAWRRLNQTIAEGKSPHREVIDGALILFGGALLLTPGFITDVFGLLMLLPPSRAVMRRLIQRMAKRRFFTKGIFFVKGRSFRDPTSKAEAGYDFEGHAEDVTESSQLPHKTGGGDLKT